MAFLRLEKRPHFNYACIIITIIIIIVIIALILIITYRSTIAIAPLARFIAKCAGLVVPEGDFGSDVEGIKPICCDVGYNKKML